MCVLVEGHCISDTVALQEMIATLATKLPYDHHHTHLIYSNSQSLEKVQSLQHLGLNISHDLSCTDPITKLASKSSHRVGMLHLSKSFLENSELLAFYKACVLNLMKCCSSLSAGTPASHLFLWASVESQALHTFEISCDEAEAQGLLLSHFREVSGLSFFFLTASPAV